MSNVGPSEIGFNQKKAKTKAGNELVCTGRVPPANSLFPTGGRDKNTLFDDAARGGGSITMGGGGEKNLPLPRSVPGPSSIDP